jgi:hypothetical protein
MLHVEEHIHYLVQVSLFQIHTHSHAALIMHLYILEQKRSIAGVQCENGEM